VFFIYLSFSLVPITVEYFYECCFFLKVTCLPSTLDLYTIRTSILRDINNISYSFKGKILDIGSGTQPYKPLIIKNASFATYITLDLKPTRQYPDPPDIVWDGKSIPLADNSIDNALATEVFEHLPSPETMLHEIFRVLKPDGLLFFTTPFLWRLHGVPFDEYRNTPFSLKRLLKNAGFKDIKLSALGGPDASLAQTLSIWIKGRSKNRSYRILIMPLLLLLFTPVVWLLNKTDKRPSEFQKGTLITGTSGTAVKPHKTIS